MQMHAHIHICAHVNMNDCMYIKYYFTASPTFVIVDADTVTATTDTSVANTLIVLNLLVLLLLLLMLLQFLLQQR